MDRPDTPPPSPLLDLIRSAEVDPDSDEAYFLAQLRSAIAGIEGCAVTFLVEPRAPRSERLAARMRGATPA